MSNAQGDILKRVLWGVYLPTGKILLGLEVRKVKRPLSNIVISGGRCISYKARLSGRSMGQ